MQHDQKILRLFVENAPGSLSMLDRDLRFVAVSRHWLNTYKLESAAVLGRTHEDVFPGAPDHWRDARRRALAGEVVRADEDLLENHQGRKLWLQWELRPWFTVTGETGGIVIYSQDISARKEAEETQARLNRALRLLKESSVAILRNDDERHLLDDVCRLFVETGGYVMAWVGVAEDDPGKSIGVAARSGYEEGYLDGIALSWDGDREIGRGPTGTALRTGLVQINQSHTANPAVAPWRDSASRRGYRASIALPLKHQDSLFGVLTAYAAEPDVFTPDEVELLRELADTVAFGIQSLRTGRQRDAAEAAAQAKSEFLSAMSHELRTPLNAILGFAQLLGSNPTMTLTERQRDYVEHIRKGGRHLLQLINEVLDLARIETGRLSLSLEPVEIRPLLAEVLDFIRAYAGATRLTIADWRFAAGVPDWVRADETRLKQVLLNLASNAVKYNAPTGTVRLEVTPSANGAVRFSISDDGPGIDVVKRQYLFEPFNRLGAEATGIEGTGVGLTISKQLVEAMDGAIGFKTEVGRGSTFWIEMPATAAPERRSGVDGSSSPAPAPPAAGPVTAGKTLLYVEDNSANVQLMRDIVEDLADFSLLTATTAEAGIEIAKIVRPDIIVLDVNLPGISGIEAARRLRADPYTAAIPLVALSADATPHTRRSGLEAGFTHYLNKPLDVARFLVILRALGG